MKYGACLALAGLALAGCGGGASKHEGMRSNAVLIIVDTLRSDIISDPEGRVATPRIDALASEGIWFDNAFAHAPMTLPSHTSLFSSRHPFETGVLNNGMDVNPELPLLAEWLKEYGYATRAVISMGTVNPTNRPNLERGFDHFDQDFSRMAQAPDVNERIGATLDGLGPEDEPFFLFLHYSDPHKPYTGHGLHPKPARILLNGEELAQLDASEMSMFEFEVRLEAGVNTLEVVGEGPLNVRNFSVKAGRKKIATEWIEGSIRAGTSRCEIALTPPDDAPAKAFLNLWVADHVKSADARARYEIEVEYVDEYVGAIVDELKERGIYDDALVMFTSDHGESLGGKGFYGHADHLGDAVLNVPLIVKPPVGHPMTADLERARGQLVKHIDLVPSLLAMLDVPPLPGQRGAFYLDLEEEHVLMAETHAPQAPKDLFCLRDLEYKMVYDVDAGTYEMFDMRADPEELTNRFEELRGERLEWEGLLVGLAEATAGGSLDLNQLSEAEREQLEALGYL